MESDPKEQIILRQYLLGELSAESRQPVEERLLTDSDFLEELAITEEELIDQYLSGDLAAPETESFETHFLATPVHRRKLTFARAFKKYVAATTDTEASDNKASDVLVPDAGASDLADTSYTQPPPSRSFFPAFLNIRSPLVGFSLAAVLLLLVGGGVGVWRMSSNRSSSNQHVISVVLTPGAARSEGEIKRVTIPPATDAVDLQLEITQGDYPSYRAMLLTDEGREAFTQTGLKAQTANNSRFVNFNVPAKELSLGDYQVKLSGQSATNEFEDLASYTFRVAQ